MCVCVPPRGVNSRFAFSVCVSPQRISSFYTNEIASQNNNHMRLHPSQRHLGVSPRFPSGLYFETFSNDMLLLVVKCLPMHI